MSDYAILAKNVVKSYMLGSEEIKVLKDISLHVECGEFVSVMGPSGSGKSTLLYLMGGLENVTAGTIEIGGQDISKMNDTSISALRRSRIGFVFQAYNLIPNLTVEENILMPVLLDGKKKKDMKMRLEEVINAVDLGDKRQSTPKELSGGQQQRVAIARAVIARPEILFADEPIGNLDSVNGTGILELLQKINREQKTTVVMVTHSEESTKYGTRVIRLKDGGIVA